jgi:hypothetical protein
MSAVSACLAQIMCGEILTGTAFTLFTRMDVPTGKMHSQNGRQRQSDQIGRIFAHWAIVYFGHFFENYNVGPNFGLHFPTVKTLILTKKYLGYILGNVFTNSHAQKITHI